jgi:hypothetical protein
MSIMEIWSQVEAIQAGTYEAEVHGKVPVAGGRSGQRDGRLLHADDSCTVHTISRTGLLRLISSHS